MSVDPRIEQFHDALASGDHEAAAEAFTSFGDATSDQASRAQVLQNLARSLNAKTQGKTDATQQYFRAANDARQKRMEAKTEFLMYLQDGPAPEDVADTVGDLIDQSKTLNDAEDTLRDAAAADLEVTQLAVLGPDKLNGPAGTPLHAEYTVENIGTATVDDVFVSLNAADELDVYVDGSVGSLAPEESATLSLSVSGDGDDATGDSHQLVVRAATDGTQASERTYVRFYSALDYVELARQAIGEANDRVQRFKDDDGGNDEDNGNGKDNGGGGPDDNPGSGTPRTDGGYRDRARTDGGRRNFDENPGGNNPGGGNSGGGNSGGGNSGGNSGGGNSGGGNSGGGNSGGGNSGGNSGGGNSGQGNGQGNGNGQGSENGKGNENGKGKGKGNGANGLAGLANKLTTADNRLESIETRLENGSGGEELPSEISSVINLLGAALNQIDALEPKHLVSQQAAFLGYNVRDAIGDLATARSLLES